MISRISAVRSRFLGRKVPFVNTSSVSRTRRSSRPFHVHWRTATACATDSQAGAAEPPQMRRIATTSILVKWFEGCACPGRLRPGRALDAEGGTSARPPRLARARPADRSRFAGGAALLGSSLAHGALGVRAVDMQTHVIGNKEVEAKELRTPPRAVTRLPSCAPILQALLRSAVQACGDEAR